jgi:GNAT superfamily N-acetyltransferase
VIEVAGTVLAVVDARSASARSAMTSYFAELAERFPEGFEPGDALDEAVVLLNPPRGLFVIATVAGDAVGCGGLQFLDPGTAEIKRMWVSPSERGRGLGRRLLARLEDEARHAGRLRIVLDTNDVLTEAINMYRSRGYHSIERYNDNPYARLWFAKELSEDDEDVRESL